MPTLVAACRDNAGRAGASRFGCSGTMAPGRRGGLLSSSECTARPAARRVRRGGAWLGCRRGARLRPAFAGWGLREPGGSVKRPDLLPARLLGGCRGRVGVGIGARRWSLVVGRWPFHNAPGAAIKYTGPQDDKQQIWSRLGRSPKAEARSPNFNLPPALLVLLSRRSLLSRSLLSR